MLAVLTEYLGRSPGFLQLPWPHRSAASLGPPDWRSLTGFHSIGFLVKDGQVFFACSEPFYIAWSVVEVCCYEALIMLGATANLVDRC